MKRIAYYLRRLAEWLDPLSDPTVLSRARELTQEWESKLGAGFGEAKRHQVYARLIKEFPEKSKRQLSAIIEAAL